MKRTLNKGFTLIELLVVIAIIGILAAVVLASLNDARSSGTNASIQQTLNNVRSQAEIFYNAQSPISYTGVCTDTDVARLTAAIDAASAPITSVVTTLATAGTASTVICHVAANGTAYAVSAPLLLTDATQRYFCVDSVGDASISTTALPASQITCP
ncbi:MAG: type II secretion system protein [Candidatus Pacebacteria bacterium]|nr:type II secretion system protein [Candidatus Paceibacterota bacterium]MBP9842659.1 type II secretion system protein [Candidatus Paceibacterota bacterium]